MLNIIEGKSFEREKAEVPFFLGTSAIKRWEHNKNMFQPMVEIIFH